MTTTVNRVALIGNLGTDPEARSNAAGTLIVTASLAVHTSYKQGEEWQQRTDWFRLVAFGESAEYLNRFSKGERIAVVGRLQSSSYTDSTGLKRTSIEVVVLRSEDAPLPHKAQPTTDPALPEGEAELVAEPAPVEDAVAPAPIEEPASKPRRRRKQAA